MRLINICFNRGKAHVPNKYNSIQFLMYIQDWIKSFYQCRLHNSPEGPYRIKKICRNIIVRIMKLPHTFRNSKQMKVQAKNYINFGLKICKKISLPNLESNIIIIFSKHETRKVLVSSNRIMQLCNISVRNNTLVPKTEICIFFQKVLERKKKSTK